MTGDRPPPGTVLAIVVADTEVDLDDAVRAHKFAVVIRLLTELGWKLEAGVQERLESWAKRRGGCSTRSVADVGAMRYSGDLAAIQQSLARCQDLVARRVAVLAALDAGIGDVVVEVGCGGGIYLREIATAVGEQGRVFGNDVSADQVAAARQYCDGLTNVTIEAGDLAGLAIADETVDAVVAVQVLEYVADVDRALSEIHRVTRPGGRFVNVATNWSALFWTGGTPSLTRAVLAAWEQHTFYPNLAVDLPGRLHAAGFGGIAQQPITIVNRRFHPNNFSWWAAQLMSAYALESGALDRNDIDAWLSSLVAADAAGNHFLSSVPILTIATTLPGTTSRRDDVAEMSQ